MNRIDPKELNKLLRYDAETGKLFWLPRENKQWTGRYAGKEALTALRGDGYKCGNIRGRMYAAHRVIVAIETGKWPDEVDHINGDKLDNRIANLRSVNATENRRNMKRRKDNSTGVCGVYYISQTGMWNVKIGVAGKKIHVGNYADLNEAISARSDAEQAHGFHPNHGRVA